VAILGALWLGLVSHVLADPPPLAEHQIKALYLLNFTKYVNWPGDAFAETNTPFIIGILGSAEVGEDLTELTRSRDFNGRLFRVRKLERETDAAGCQMLFVGSADSRRISALLQRLGSLPVLTVGESEEFLAQGGTIVLLRKANKVQLRINLQAAQRARLSVSAKLLAVTEVMRARQPTVKD
jgi:hypothetical protein